MPAVMTLPLAWNNTKQDLVPLAGHPCSQAWLAEACQCMAPAACHGKVHQGKLGLPAAQLVWTVGHQGAAPPVGYSPDLASWIGLAAAVARHQLAPPGI